MGLRELMEQNRDHILRLTRETVRKRSRAEGSSRELDGGMPNFYDQVITTLRTAEQSDIDTALPPPSRMPSSFGKLSEAAAQYGKELRRLGFSASQVVHVYGSLCDAVTRTAKELRVLIDPAEFNLLNRCLDYAIGEAVTEFEADREKSMVKQQTKHLGFLMHELRNALSNAVFAVQLIKNGAVGASGRTGEALDRNLARMRDLIDRSLTEVRLRSDANLRPEKFEMAEILREIEVMASADVASRGLGLEVRVEAGLELDADRHMIVSAVANLVQNAIKFTHTGGTVVIRATAGPHHTIVVEVQDECGGLPPGRSYDLTHPTPFDTTDPSGVGLGLSIVQQAVHLHGGQVRVTDLPGIGCIFSIALPRAGQDTTTAKPTAQRTDSNTDDS